MSKPDSKPEPGRQDFPVTSWSAIAASRDPTSPAYHENLERLCKAYWKPVFHFFHKVRRLSLEEAKDLTQEFFLHLMQGSLLVRAEEAKGRFRNYLKVSLRNFASDAQEKARSRKRGGQARIFRLDLDDEELRLELADPHSPDPGEELDRRWARVLVKEALRLLQKDLRRRGREREFDMFRDYYYPSSEEKEKLTYAKLSRRYETSAFEVANSLNRVRRRFREAVMDLIRDTVCSEQAALQEFEELFGSEKEEGPRPGRGQGYS